MNQKLRFHAKWFVVALALLSTAYGQQDVTRPGDPVLASSGNSPAGEGVGNVIDNKPETKYLNFDNAKGEKASGFVVTPSAGVSVVTGMTLQSANDAPERDPWSILLEGSNDGAVTDFVSGTWVEIFYKEEIPAFATRGQTQSFSFENATAYKHYRWTVYDTQKLNDCCMQVAEVELLGTIPGGGEPPVDVPLAISKDLPSSKLVIAEGARLSLDVQAQGGVAPLSYQWWFARSGEKNADGSPAWKQLAGKTSAALTIDGTTPSNSGIYTVQVADAAGTLVSGRVLEVDVTPRPVVTNQPLQITKNLQPQTQAMDVRDGDSLILELQVQGGVAPVTFEWKYTKGGSDPWTTVAGQTAATLRIDSASLANAGFYYAVIFDGNGKVITSEIARVKIVPQQQLLISKNLQPQSKPLIVTEGDRVALELGVLGGVAPYTVEWKYTKGGSDAWSTVAGQTAPTLLFPSITRENAGFYYVNVSDAAGGTVQSEISKIEVEPKSTGTIIADLGFRPRTDGFPFENYVNTLANNEKALNLTPAEVRRMFGDRVVSRVNGAEIVLTPPARKWMEEISNSMNGGHCAGLSYMSLLVYTKHLEISGTFGVNSLQGLTLEKNPRLQREIGYWWATQVVSPGGDRIAGTPVEILDRLIAALKPDATDTYSIAIFKRDWTGGHAVTPYAVEDKGNNVYDVLLYDNNWPNRTRRMTIDRTKNTWQYSASINPQANADLYEGDATTRTLFVEPMSRHNQMQICGFCDDGSSAAARSGFSNSEGPLQLNEIFVDGNGVHLLITDAQGRRYGWDNGVFIQEIPDVSHRLVLGADLWNDARSPVFLVPAQEQFEFTLSLPKSLDVSSPTNQTYTAVTMIGDGFEIAVEDIYLDPGEVDTLVFSPDGTSLAYTSSASESPDLTLGFVAPDADFEFTVAGVETDPGATIHLKVDKTKGTLTLSSSGNTEVGYYDLAVVRYDDDSEQEFYHDEIELEPKDLAILDYGTWQGDSDTLDLRIDWDGDGTIDEFLELTDDQSPDLADATGPRLKAAQIGGRIEISWSDEDLFFTLESSTDLGMTGWFPITEDQIVTQDGVRKFIIDANAGTGRYFRLSDDY
ncbi:MAG: immunoglobulin domain-containing protein [Verrucomicrobia bacterium]|nr:immunoglobulin domain-containing protein [Verrucomicrobiota bacterium]